MLSASQSEALSRTAAELSLDDELTFMLEVWDLVIGTHRTVKDMDVPDKLIFVETAWEKDDPKYNWGSPFAANLTPPLRFADPNLQCLQNSHDLTNRDRLHWTKDEARVQLQSC